MPAVVNWPGREIDHYIVIISVAFAQKNVLKDEQDITLTFSESGD